MITTETIVAYIEELAGHKLNRDEGVHHGSSQREVQKVLVTWMATPAALEEAGQIGADLVLAHESLYYPYNASVRQDNPAGWESWQTNRQRRELLDKHSLTFLRVHGTMDELTIFDDFAALLGLGKPVEDKPDWLKVYEFPPCFLGELAARAKKAVGMEAIRVSAPQGMAQVVHRVGLPWGGMGLFVNVSYQERLIALGCDVLIAGESDDYGFRFAAECGIPMIETGHEISENPGLKRFVEMLGGRFPELMVRFHECQPSWQMA